MSSDNHVEKAFEAFKSIKPDKEQLLRWHAALEKRRLQKNQRWARLKLVSLGVALGLIFGVACTLMLLSDGRSSNADENFSATFAMISVKNL